MVPFSVALSVPGHRSGLLRCMLESAAHELRARGIRWTVVEAGSADVTFRQRPATQGDPRTGNDLYAEIHRAGSDAEQIRVDGPLRSAAMVTVLSRIARSLRPGAGASGATGSSVALRWLDAWCNLAASAPVDFSLGASKVAVLDPRRGTWHAAIGTATPDLEALLDRMTREPFALQPASAAAPTDGVPLKPLLWQLGLTAGAAGLLPSLAQPRELRLKGWPYLAAGGPRSFGDMIRQLRGAPVDLTALRELGLAPPDELHGFLNACHACGYLQAVPAAGAFGQRSPALPLLPPAAVARRGAGRSAGVLGSIRRSLGIGAE